MASVATVVREIHSVRKFFESRNATHAGAGKPTSLEKSFADSVINKVNLIKSFGPADGAQLYEALNCSPFGDEHTARILSVIDHRLQTGADAETATPGNDTSSTNKQHLRTWWNYLTQNDVDFLTSPSESLNAKMTTIAERGNRLGLNAPDEQTYKWSMAVLLLCHYKNMPEPQLIYDKLQDFKKVWSCETKPWCMERLLTFPDAPAQLPSDVYKAAYGDDSPVTVSFHGINTVAELIPLRRNSKLLKSSLAKTTKQELAAAFADNSNVNAGPPIATTQVKAELPAPDEAKPDHAEDPEEIAIKKEAEAKIARLRATRQTQTSASSQSCGLLAHRNPDGSIELRPKSEPDGSRCNTAGTPIKADSIEAGASKADALMSPKVEPGSQITAETSGNVAPVLEHLDPWTQAAIVALQKRNEAKKTLAADTKRKRSAAKKNDDAGKDNDDDDDDDDDDDEDSDNDDTDKHVLKKPASKKVVAKRPAGKIPIDKKKGQTKTVKLLKKTKNEKETKSEKKTKKKKKKIINMKMIFRELHRVGPTISRNRFTSRAYHACRSIKEKEGCSSDDSKKHARKASQKAGRMYDTFPHH
jgi:antitoxin (DNA-binding transcriptional repressor) of toxin-antitoxin stability system